MSDTKVCMGIIPNPDVSGLGIRLGLYITVFLLAIIPRQRRMLPLISSLLDNTRVFTLSLLLSAIIQTGQGRLTLYHATLINHILFFFGLTLLPSLSECNTKGTRRLTIVTTLSFLTYFAWSLHVWTNALTFGSQPECNHSTKIVFMWVTVRTIASWMRKLWTAGPAMAVAYVVVIAIGRALGCAGVSFSDFTSSWTGVIFRLMWFGAGVSMIELMVKRNYVLPGENVWAFGQVLSLVLLLGFCNDAIKWYNNEIGESLLPVTTPNVTNTAKPSMGSVSSIAASRGSTTSIHDVSASSAALNTTDASGGATTSRRPAGVPIPAASHTSVVKPSTSTSTSAVASDGGPKLSAMCNVLDGWVEPKRTCDLSHGLAQVGSSSVDVKFG
ncbi:hypothetical protein BD410DRAFT_756415 [Rickenella mellea]|uniref:Uncharacterized protein n=1 Tax=Rickenella mellea TaxID=50990 RepID=A0A4Y7PK94_9AGAM|nr:hypothetical protein BD410DRAFT_756415 [Rickenella mellea]